MILTCKVLFPNSWLSFYAFTALKVGKSVNGLKLEIKPIQNLKYHLWSDSTSISKSERKKIEKNQSLLKLFNQEIKIKSKKPWKSKKRKNKPKREDMTQVMYRKRQKKLTVIFHKLSYSWLSCSCF